MPKPPEMEHSDENPNRLLLFDTPLLDITISRLSQELIENHEHFENSVLMGMQPRGIFFAERIQKRVFELSGTEIPLGKLDITFYRDDFRRRTEPIRANTTDVPFIIEDKNVILIDDVLFTGRTIRAALEAMTAFGRPESVELMVLVDRKYSRNLPVAPDYVGRSVNTIQSQRVKVEWKEQGFEHDRIRLTGAEY